MCDKEKYDELLDAFDHLETKMLGEISSIREDHNISVSKFNDDFEAIRKMLEKAHINDAAIIMEGGEKFAGFLKWCAKVSVALGTIYVAFTQINWHAVATWFQALFHWRPH